MPSSWGAEKRLHAKEARRRSPAPSPDRLEVRKPTAGKGFRHVGEFLTEMDLFARAQRRAKGERAAASQARREARGLACGDTASGERSEP